ncbi:MAG: PilZ domain-containing protein [Planctomycetes bacterium]|nr:PilZ domain-containing protein [Planctomycetota bacterium]
MAVAESLINLFPRVTGAGDALTDVALVLGGLSLAGGWAAWAHRRQRHESVRLVAVHHGLTEEDARFVIEVLGRDGPEAVRTLLRAPMALRQRLASELGRSHRLAGASRFAARAASLAGALRLRDSRFPCAPRLFEEVELRDPQDAAPPVRAWVVQVDEERLAVVSTATCTWPVRKDLFLVRVQTEGADPVLVTLLLRPMPGSPEWVLEHEFDWSGSDRRRERRVGCQIPAWSFASSAGTYALRARLQLDQPVDMESLRRLPGWSERHQVVVEDISADGARLSATHCLERGDRFYVALSRPDGTIAALPLVEVVSCRPCGDDGRLVGVRFCALRSRERDLLAEYAGTPDRTGTPVDTHV